MSNINQTSKEIKKKLSFGDYEQPVTIPINQSSNKDKNEEKSPKIKVTYYLSKVDNKALTDIYIKRIQDNEKTDKSALIAEAIQLLYKKEIKG